MCLYEDINEIFPGKMVPMVHIVFIWLWVKLSDGYYVFTNEVQYLGLVPKESVFIVHFCSRDCACTNPNPDQCLHIKVKYPTLAVFDSLLDPAE
jgi:hypothetical protein